MGGYNEIGLSSLNGHKDHMLYSYNVVQRGEHYGAVEGLAGTAYKPGYFGHHATDTGDTDLYTFDACVFGDVPTVIYDWDRNETNTHDTAGADGDEVFVIPVTEVPFARIWYKDNVALIPGNKLCLSATAGNVDLQVDATLVSTDVAYGFTSNGVQNAAEGQSLPNRTVAISWTSLVSVASRAETPILGQIMVTP